jgi:hypothetical protein
MTRWSSLRRSERANVRQRRAMKKPNDLHDTEGREASSRGKRSATARAAAFRPTPRPGDPSAGPRGRDLDDL